MVLTSTEEEKDTCNRIMEDYDEAQREAAVCNSVVVPVPKYRIVTPPGTTSGSTSKRKRSERLLEQGPDN